LLEGTSYYQSLKNYSIVRSLVKNEVVIVIKIEKKISSGEANPGFKYGAPLKKNDHHSSFYNQSVIMFKLTFYYWLLVF
jgi:hypothetical protein